MLASDPAIATGLTTTLSEWQGIVWLWYCDAMAMGACPSRRHSGAHTIHDWPTRNAVSVASALSRTNARERVSLMDRLHRVMWSKVVRRAPEG
jgi:hypothetical protein